MNRKTGRARTAARRTKGKRNRNRRVAQVAGGNANQLSAQSSMNALGNRSQPHNRSRQQEGVIEREELITLVEGTTGFGVLKFPVQPANPTTFPVGSPEAVNWTEWQADMIEVEYIPTVSEFATQGQQGEVALGVDYNAANLSPTAMNQIEAMQFAGGGIPSRGFKLTLQPRFVNKSDPKYIRAGSLPAGDDIRLYDGGNIWFATAGCNNTSQIGKLLVRYRFRVRLPTLLNPDEGGLYAPVRTSLFQITTGQTAAGPTAAVTFDDDLRSFGHWS
jgi:hypothetical protein